MTKQQKQALFDAWDFEVLGKLKKCNYYLYSGIGNWNGSTLSSLQARVGRAIRTLYLHMMTNGAVKTIVKTNKANTLPPAKRSIIIKMPKKHQRLISM